VPVPSGRVRRYTVPTIRRPASIAAWTFAALTLLIKLSMYRVSDSVCQTMPEASFSITSFNPMLRTGGVGRSHHIQFRLAAGESFPYAATSDKVCQFGFGPRVITPVGG
jgi:hypothetical protein